MIVVSLKYVTLVLRADNRGEGGIMALLALATGAVRDRPRWRAPLRRHRRVRRGAVLRRRGADARDLGAVRGRGPGGRHRRVQAVRGADRHGRPGRAVPHPAARHRRRRAAVRAGVRCSGSSRIGAAGVWNIAQESGGPRRARSRCMRCASSPRHGVASFLVLGSVLLAITGAEALYADMGHFGKRAIRIALVRPGRRRRWCSTTSARARC